ncbi:magnesium chelatase domain-containing protein [Rickettsia sibirica]
MLSSIGLALHTKKILINLVLADLVKEGSHFDLAIACAILTAMNILSELEIAEYWIIGELSLDGKLTKARPCRTPHYSCSLAAMVGGGVGKK